MPQFAKSIPEEYVSQLTVPPPPLLDAGTGEFVHRAAPDASRYRDLALVKRQNVVYLDEELDVYGHPGSHEHYRLMIRRMPWKSDLMVILAAARHMLLVDDYEVSYEHREGLLPELESGYWCVRYKLPVETCHIDCDTWIQHVVTVPFILRRQIWTDLFAALGHRVKFGGSVLNVRRKKSEL